MLPGLEHEIWSKGVDVRVAELLRVKPKDVPKITSGGITLGATAWAPAATGTQGLLTGIPGLMTDATKENPASAISGRRTSQCPISVPGCGAQREIG
jgi:hypothetical protein